ncbi:alanine racemase [Williamsia sp. CHRR-6]|uniref:alanine racemase n=1 Tax=Williamsia sp. CHRR-6 TaxID=2835871 RepID=UPI001BDA7B78|nr:alanine racemase [Williamsia sp. CHRR-6]MBT0565826.1 alanine racemase [Williamsia sp. CHRR-6]
MSGSPHSPDWTAISAAVADLDGPVVVVDVDALEFNIADVARRAGGVPIRVASKSLRVRGIIEDILARDGFAGVLAYDLAEAHWLATASSITDVLVGYPTANRHAIAALAADEVAAARVTLLVDSIEGIDLICAAVPAPAPPIRVAIDVDASLRAPVVGHIGVWRSPVHDTAQASALARAIIARPQLRLVGAMSYEAQIAGVGDAAGNLLHRSMIRVMQRRSAAELRTRRARVIAAIQEVADLEFVNAGGTGSIEFTATDPSVTDIAAGSGFFGGHLFDTYRHFQPAPAMAFGLTVVRRPATDVITCHGGGWVASGPPGPDRLPRPVWPAGLRYFDREAAGEVQTPLRGPAAATLSIGDRVWFRHSKSGETAEHTDEIVLVRSGQIVGRHRTYRGEGKCFL